MKKILILLVVLQYTLPFLNIALLIWIILMNHAYVYPTSEPISYALRSHGYYNFGIITIVLCAVAVTIGLANMFVLYQLYYLKPHRWDDVKRNLTFHCCPWARLYLPITVFLLLLVGSYGIISSLAFRKVFAKRAYENACNGYTLMAEIEVLPSFGYDGGNASMFGASSRVTFYKDGKESYMMDLVRHYRMILGFNDYRRGSQERARMSGMDGWGFIKMKLVEGEGHRLKGMYGTQYWDGSRFVERNETGNGRNGTVGGFIARNITANGTIGGNSTALSGGNSTAAGPIGEVVLDLMRSTFVLHIAYISCS